MNKLLNNHYQHLLHKLYLHILVFITLIYSTSCSNNSSITEYVDPFIGTDGTGHTFPGATLPFGMVQLSPDTRDSGWENCSGYHSTNKTILGFSHTHLSGTGAIDYGDILVMPMAGEYYSKAGDENNSDNGYRSRFNKEDEIAETSPPAQQIDPREKKREAEYYEIKSGDTLWSIARSYPGVSADDLMRWNGIDERIQEGQVILLFPPKDRSSH